MRNSISRTLFIFIALLSIYIGLPFDSFAQEKTEHIAVKQRDFCSSWTKSYNGRVGFSEVREFKLPASGRVQIDGGKNGGISLKVLTFPKLPSKLAYKRGTTDDAAQAVSRISLSVLAIRQSRK